MSASSSESYSQVSCSLFFSVLLHSQTFQQRLPSELKIMTCQGDDLLSLIGSLPIFITLSSLPFVEPHLEGAICALTRANSKHSHK